MGHDAFYLVDVITSTDGEKITCITYFGDFVYLGTAGGKLLQYRVTTKPAVGGRIEHIGTKERAVDVGQGSRSAVVQVEAMPEMGLLAVLCEGAMSLHRLTNVDRIPTLLDSKNVVSFSVNARAKRICIVSSKRRLKLYEWIDGKFAPLRGHPELDVPDVPRAVSYYGTRIALGYSREYNILYEDTGEVRDIAGDMKRDTRPLIKHLPGDNLLLVCGDGVGVVVNGSGEPVPGTAVLQFKHHPLGIAYCYPYILSIGEGNKEVVEVHSSREGRDETIQTMTLPTSGGAAVVGVADGRVGTTSKYDMDSFDAPSLGMGGSGSRGSGSGGGSKGRNPVYVAFGNPGRVCRLQPVPVDRQVEDMIRQYLVVAAMELIVNTCPSSSSVSGSAITASASASTTTSMNLLESKLARLNIDAGRVFFLGLHFEQAFPFLTASPMDPREILQMFPDLLPGSTTCYLSPSPALATSSSSSSSNKTNNKGASSSSSRRKSDVSALLDGPGSSGGGGGDGIAGLYFVYSSRYFGVSLTHAIASGTKQPGEAASESADATGGAMMGMPGGSSSIDSGRSDIMGSGGGGNTATNMIAATFGGFMDGSCSGGVVQTGVADIGGIVKAQLPAYIKRLKGRGATAAANDDDDDGVPSDLRVGGSGSIETTTADSRSVVAYSGVLKFLRQRRRVILRALNRLNRNSRAAARAAARRGVSGGNSSYNNAYKNAVDDDDVEDDDNDDDYDNMSNTNDTENSLGADGASSGGIGAGETEGLPLHAIRIARGRERKFEARGSAFSCDGYTESELRQLASIVDGAIMKCFAALNQVKHLDRFVFNANRIEPEDAVPFLRAQGRFHTLALYYAGRGASRDALTIWRELGLESVKERSSASSSYSTLDLSKEDMERFFGKDNQGRGGSSSSRRSSTSSDGNENGKARNGANRDSLSDFEDIVDSSVSGGVGGEKKAMQQQLGVGRRAGAGVDVTPLALALGRIASSASSSSAAAVASHHDGIEDTIAYLRSSDDAALVFEYAEWLLLRHPQRAMLIFTKPLRTKMIPDDAILDYLSAPKLLEVGRRNPAANVVRLYLEHLVVSRMSKEERYHTRLAREYIASVMQLRGDMPSAGAVFASSSSVTSSSSSSSSSTSSSAALSSMSLVSARLALAGTVSERPAPGTEGGTLGELRGKLVRLLQESDLYDAGALMGLVRDSTLYEESVLLHARLGQHEPALRLLITELADADRAVRYCELQALLKGTAWFTSNGSAIAGQQNGDDDDPFLCLLRLYLNAHAAASSAGRDASSSSSSSSITTTTATTASVYLRRALDLLSSHAHHMDALAAAKLLPGDLPLHSLLGYCTRVLPSSAHAAREAFVVKNLYNYRYIDLRSTLVEKQVRSATLTRNSYCYVCDKRIGDAVFAVLPDNRPVHFHCSRDTAALLVTTSSSSSNSGNANKAKESSPTSSSSSCSTVNRGSSRSFRLYAAGKSETSSSSSSSSSSGGGGGGGEEPRFGNDDTEDNSTEEIDFTHEFGGKSNNSSNNAGSGGGAQGGRSAFDASPFLISGGSSVVRRGR